MFFRLYRGFRRFFGELGLGQVGLAVFLLLAAVVRLGAKAVSDDSAN